MVNRIKILLAAEEIKRIGHVVPKSTIELMTYEPRDCCYCLKLAVLNIRCYVSSWCHKLISHPAFDPIILVIIFLNSVILATDDPTTIIQERWQEIADFMFQIIYTIEFLIKVLALGLLFNRGAYLRDAWNILDLIVVIFGYLQYLHVDNGGFDLRPLRVLRVLRPVWKINSIEGVKTLTTTLINSFGLLIYIAGVYFVILCLFAVIGFQIWHDTLKKRCRNIATGQFNNTETLCGYMSCPNDFECAYYESNPNHGIINFDNFFSSLLITFTVSTGEGWGMVQKALIEANGYYVALFFELILFVELYFLQNFILGALKHNVYLLHEENKKNTMLPFVMSHTIAKYKTLGNSRRALMSSEESPKRNKLFISRWSMHMEQ